MYYCPKCGIGNDEDSLFCKRCGFPLDEDPKNYSQNSDSKPKQKRGKTKVKKTKSKTKVKYKEQANGKEKGKMSFFQSFMMFFFILLSICALGVAGFLGYYIYQNSNIVVPDVTGFSYAQAERVLDDANLQAEKTEKIVTDEDEVGIVIYQNKKSGSKVMKNTVIKLTVGVLDTKVIVPNVEGLTLDEALDLLNENNVKYEIIYEPSDKENNIVLDQSIRANKKIENTETVTITVSKNEKTQTSQSNDNKVDDTDQNSNTTSNNQTNSDNPQTDSN